MSFPGAVPTNTWRKMMTRCMKTYLVAMFALSTLFLWSGCSSSTDPDDDDDGGQVPQIEEAEDALASSMYVMMNLDDLNSPDEVDFTEAEDLYARILQDEPGNVDARLGAAVTGVLSVMADAEVNAAFDEWEAYLENNTPFEADSGTLQPMGIPLSPVPHGDSLELPLGLMKSAVMAGMPWALDSVNPSVGEVQTIFRTKVIPRLVAATEHLAVVAQTEGFSFTITPRMQGDLEANPQEFDVTDAYALRAAGLLLTAACRMAVAYDLNFLSYDGPGIEAALDRESGTFLSLASDGAAMMAQAENDFLAAIDALDDGIDALFAETDNQYDDLIIIGPDDLDQTEVLEFQLYDLADARTFLTDGWEFTEDWDGDWMTPDITLEVVPHNFMQNPVADWKQVLPPYAIGTTIGNDYAGWVEDVSYEEYTFDLAAPTYGSATLQAEFSDGQNVYLNTWGNDALEQVLLDFTLTLSPDFLEDPAIEGDQVWVTIYISGDYLAGPNTDDIEINVGYEVFDHYYVPVFTWEAQNFDDWVAGMANYTLNGLLPGVTSSQELMSIFGMTADDWEQELIVEWYDLDVDDWFDDLD